MRVHKFRIIVGTALSAAALCAPAVPPLLVEYLISSAHLSLTVATAHIWQWLSTASPVNLSGFSFSASSCTPVFLLGGGLLVGSAFNKGVQNTQCDAAIKRLSATIKKHEQVHKEKSEQCAQYLIQSTELGTRCRELTSERDRINYELRQMRAAVTERDGTIRELSVRLDTCAQANTEWARSNAEWQAYCQTLTLRSDELRAERDSLQTN